MLFQWNLLNFLYFLTRFSNASMTSQQFGQQRVSTKEDAPSSDEASFDDKTNLQFPSTNPDTSVALQLERLLSKHPYELSIRPINDGQPIKVGVFLLIESITDISEKNMDLTFTLQMHETWKDERLAFNASHQTNSIVLTSRLISKLWVPGMECLWHPDIDLYIVGSKRSFVHRTMVENLVMRLFSDGEVYYTVKITTTVACQMDLKTFPLDTENCFLTLQSLGYNNDELMLEWVVGEHKNDLFMETGLVRNMPKYTLVHHNYHSFNSSASDMPKFTGVTSVLTISTIITGLKASLPKVSYLTALDVYLWACFLFVFSTVFEYCILNFLTMKRAAIVKEKNSQKEALKIRLENCKEDDHESSFQQKKCSNESELIYRLPIDRKNSKKEGTSTTNEKCNGRPVKIQSEENDFCCLPSNLCDCKSDRIHIPNCIPQYPAVIDSYFRVLYFTGFALFNCFYWVGYWIVTQHDSDEE